VNDVHVCSGASVVQALRKSQQYFVYVDIHVCMSAYMYMCVCMYACIYACMYASVYIVQCSGP
jgi:hypothetical protein